MKRKWLCCALATVIVATSVAAEATQIYRESFDSSSIAVGFESLNESTNDVVDYSNFNVSGLVGAIPEAPRTQGGDTATSGLLLSVNQTQNAGSVINGYALDAVGGNPLAVSGNYILSYDVYMNIGSGSTTQQALWGVGTDGAGVVSRITRNDGTNDGTWGWAAADGGWGSSGDFNYWIEAATGPSETLDAFDSVPQQFIPSPPYGVAGQPHGEWLEVDIVVGNGEMRVRYNGKNFFTFNNVPSVGTGMLGWEDSFSSLVTNPESQWAVFDNFTITQIPEPTSALLLILGVCTAAVCRRRES